MGNLKLKKESVIILVGVILLIIGGFLSFTKKSEKNYYSVSFYVEEGNLLKEQKVESGEKIEIEDPIKEGYTFDGWYVGDEKFDFSTKVDGDVKLVAKWTKIDDTDPGSNPTTDPGKDPVVDPVIDPGKDPVVDPGKDPAIKKKKNPVTDPVVDEKTYIVKFNTDGGSKVADLKVVEGKTVTKPANPIKEGYTFAGWYLNGKQYDFNTKVTANITLTAKWEVSKYTVTFNTDGGNAIASQKVEYGKKATKPQDPTKKYYKFVEWQLNGKKYDFNSPVKGNITIKAVWLRDGIFNVVFDSAGGSKVNTQEVEKGKMATRPSNPTREGYTFIGWFLNDKEYNFQTPVNEDIKLVAKWEIIKYTVTFDTKGGTRIPNQTVEYGKKVTKPANPTKDGFIFTGWTVNGKTYDFSSSVKSNLTIVANYREKSYTFKVSTIDEYSPDRTITVYEEGSQINFTSIKVNGVVLCSGSNPTVSKYDIEGVNSVTVVLLSGTEVTARKG